MRAARDSVRSGPTPPDGGVFFAQIRLSAKKIRTRFSGNAPV